MPESNVIEQPVVSQQVTSVIPVENKETVKEPDLLTKVSQFKAQNQTSEIKNAPEQPEFESIKDPVAREAAKQAVERLRRGFQSEYDRKLEEAQKVVEKSKNWTPQRIQQELLNNPEFLSAAQQVAASQNPPNSGLTDEQFSSLTDKEKQEITSLKNEVNQLKQTNSNAILQSTISNKDAQLQSKYADYNPVSINSATERLASMTMADIREYVYKADNHDDHVKAAYEMGKQDGRNLTQTKIGGISADGLSSTNNEGALTKNAGESDHNFIVRIAQKNLELFRKK